MILNPNGLLDVFFMQFTINLSLIITVVISNHCCHNRRQSRSFALRLLGAGADMSLQVHIGAHFQRASQSGVSTSQGAARLFVCLHRILAAPGSFSRGRSDWPVVHPSAPAPLFFGRNLKFVFPFWPLSPITGIQQQAPFC